MNKLETLRSLESKGLNVHNYVAFNPKNLNVIGGKREILHIKPSGSYTVRFDRYGGFSADLPFAVLDSNQFDIVDFCSLRKSAEKLGCYLIISDGRQYDKYLKYNIVCKVEHTGSFFYEFSPLQVPLRHMYRYPTSCVIGNLSDSKESWHIEKTASAQVNLPEVKRIVWDIYARQIHGRFIECTLYTRPVGQLNTNMVFWHIA